MKNQDVKSFQFKDDNSLEKWLEENKPKDTFKVNALKLWWRFTGRLIPRDFIYGVKNLVRWFPIIWKDRGWDHSYIYTVLAFKLKLQSICIAEDGGIYFGAERDAEVIMMCSKLAERLSVGYYEDEEMEYKYVSDYINKYPNTYKKVLREHPNIEPLQLKYYIADEITNKAKRILFKTMENRIEEWWS